MCACMALSCLCSVIVAASLVLPRCLTQPQHACCVGGAGSKQWLEAGLVAGLQDRAAACWFGQELGWCQVHAFGH
jgi:hypothetical protein